MEDIALLQKIKDWIRVMGQRGIYGGASARLRSTAVEQMLSVVGAEEPKDAQWALDNIASLAKRWATKNQANPGTTSTYLSRAKSTIGDYIAYQKDPTKTIAPRSSSSRNGRESQREHEPATTDTVKSISPDPSVDEQRFVIALSGGKRATLAVPVHLSALDIKILQKQIEILELQVSGEI
ncbi:MAG: hypothetical protein WCG85_22905 [Polyangia bacterium]